jgi:hypothetical protein
MSTQPDASGVPLSRLAPASKVSQVDLLVFFFLLYSSK